MSNKFGLNNRGGLDNVVGALVGLLVAIITLYAVMVVWQPVTSTMLFPLLSNAEAFPYGGAAITILQVFVLVAVAAIFLAFFSEARGERQGPPGYGY